MAETESSIPLQHFILKVHGRCNLACTYCYVYESADQSWRTREKAMDDATLAKAAQRIGEQARRFSLPEVKVILHGGEPLLIGAKGVEKVVSTMRAAVPESCAVGFNVQTNGTLLTPKLLETLRDQRVRVGVSLDGPEAANDQARIYRNGKGSFAEVQQGLELLRDQFKDIYGGILCTVNLDADPLETYETLKTFKPPAINFLLPHYNWSNLPPAYLAEGASVTKYADWLIPIFDRWAHSKKTMDVMLFNSIIHLLGGEASFVESIGLTPSALLVIETDGAMEQVDSLKSTFDGAAETGMNIFEHSIEQVQAHPDMRRQQLGLAALSDTCQKCPIVTVCGGGYLPHRWSQEKGFDNPSVYCQDLTKLIGHVKLRMEQYVAELKRRRGLAEGGVI